MICKFIFRKSSGLNIWDLELNKISTAIIKLLLYLYASYIFNTI